MSVQKKLRSISLPPDMLTFVHNPEPEFVPKTDNDIVADVLIYEKKPNFDFLLAYIL